MAAAAAGARPAGSRPTTRRRNARSAGKVLRADARRDQLEQLGERLDTRRRSGMRRLRRRSASPRRRRGPSRCDRVRAHLEARARRASQTCRMPSCGMSQSRCARACRRSRTPAARRPARATSSPLRDQAHAERPVVRQAGLGHVDVALLEDLERQQAAGKQHGVQRKQRQRERLPRRRLAQKRQHQRRSASTDRASARVAPARHAARAARAR